MRKENQDLFYATIGRALTRAREQKKLTISQLSKICGEQYNTLKGIEDGKPCSLHHASWMRNTLGLNLNILMSDAINENNIKEEEHVEEIREEVIEKEEPFDLSSFI